MLPSTKPWFLSVLIGAILRLLTVLLNVTLREKTSARAKKNTGK